MNQRRTSSILNFKNTSLAKLIVSASKGKLTGCIKIKSFQPKLRLVVWLDAGDIIGVTGTTSIIDKLAVYGLVSERVIDNIKNENLIAPIGEKLVNAYGVSDEGVARLFNEQIEEIDNQLGLNEGEVTIARVKRDKFPWAEMTGLKASGYQVVKDGLEKNFAKRYRDKVPERQRTIESGITEIDAVKLDKTYLKIISFCNTNATLVTIAKKLELPLSQVQKKVYILNILGIVEMSITKDAAMELYRKFNPNSNPLQGRNTSFNRQNGWKVPLLSISGINLLVLILTYLGTFQGLELGLLDRLIRLRGTQTNEDIVIVAMDDQDIAQFPRYPIADRYLAKVIENLAEADPSAIGLDIYRDLPQEPGHVELLTAYSNTPQLFGVEKIDEGDRVNAPPILREQGRVGFSDLVLDADKVLRRGTWMVEGENELKYNLGAIVALQHLNNQTLQNGRLVPITSAEQEPVSIIQSENDSYRFTFGQTTFTNLKESSGGYWRKQVVGLQKILGFRYNTDDFKTISFFNAYRGRFDPSDLEGKIILIGVTADSKKDFVYSPLSKIGSQSRPMPGVVAHANIAADLIDAAKGIRPIQVNSKLWEAGWIVFWSVFGLGVGIVAIEINLKSKQKRSAIIFLQGIFISICSFVTGTLAFLLGGYWIPIIPALANALASSVVANFQYQSELESLLYADKQSQVANRHYFDNIFEQYISEVQLRDGNLGLVLCQIVNWEQRSQKLDSKNKKMYLRELAKIVEQKVKLNNPDNLIGRFTDDTFAALVLDTNQVKLGELTENIKAAVKVSKILTKFGLPELEFGSAISDRKTNNTLAMIAEADEKLVGTQT